MLALGQMIPVLLYCVERQRGASAHKLSVHSMGAANWGFEWRPLCWDPAANKGFQWCLARLVELISGTQAFEISILVSFELINLKYNMQMALLQTKMPFLQRQ